MLDHRYIQTNLFSNDDHLIQEGSRPFHSWPHFVPHLVLFFTFHSLTLNYTFILYLFIVCFCLWNVSSTRAGTRLFVLSPAVFPAPTMVLSIELGPINISEQIEDKPLLCADAFFFFCIIATDVITALQQKRLKWREINVLVWNSRSWKQQSQN